MVSYLATNPSMSTNAKLILNLGQYVVAIFAFIFLIYSNSFIFKNRKKEFGVFNILGLEKRHIAKIVGFETLYMSLFSIIVGLAVGIASSKLLFLGIAKMMKVKLDISLEISKDALVFATVIIVAIFIFLYIKSVISVYATKTIDLLKGGQQGEKEPKAKWLLAIAGVGTLGYAYYLSLTIKNPMKAMNTFFIAVLLVIIGTYLLFTAGSIVLLKCLKKNKNYYYQTNHFISVSGMIYRMKQNAAGLSNICILSTTVIVMLTSAISLFSGMNELLDDTCPTTFVVEVRPDSTKDNDQNLTAENIKNYAYPFKDVHKNGMSTIGQAQLETQKAISNYDVKIKSEKIIPVFAPAILSKDDKSEKYEMVNTFNLTIESVANFGALYVVTADTYNMATGENLALEQDEVATYIEDDNNKIVDNNKTFEIGSLKFNVAKHLKKNLNLGQGSISAGKSVLLVVKDLTTLDKLYSLQFDNFNENSSVTTMDYLYYCDTNASEQQQEKMAKEINANTVDLSENSRIELSYRAEMKQFLSEFYGSIFFLALFLGILFTVAMVLIIYYKQISEGYDDRKRFEIMQNVGLSRKEVKSAINSQVLTVFFLPLITAFIHTLFACPILSSLLTMLGLSNKRLFIVSTGSSMLIFAVLYLVIYFITSKVYYKIVKKQ